MELLDEAIGEFNEIVDFFEGWKTGEASCSETSASTTLDRQLFEEIMKRYVSVARKLTTRLYDMFDVYVVEKNRNPMIVKRSGKKDKKIRFGSRKFPIHVVTSPDDELPLLQEVVSFTKQELSTVNKLYVGTLKICRLLLYMKAIENDSPETTEPRVMKVVTDSGIVRGILTFSPNASSQKEIDEYLEVTDSCRNLSSVEILHMDDATFGLKLVIAKLKRMRHPYVTAIQSVVEEEYRVEADRNSLPERVSGDYKEESDVAKRAVTAIISDEGRGDFGKEDVNSSQGNSDIANWELTSKGKEDEKCENIELRSLLGEGNDREEGSGDIGFERNGSPHSSTAEIA